MGNLYRSIKKGMDYYMGISPVGSMSSIIPVIVVMGFIAVICFMIVVAVKGGMQWNRNNNSPLLSVAVKIVAKRTSVSTHHHHHGNDMSMHHMSASSTYYATFELENGDRMELRIPNKEAGMLAEGDTGRLTFQGTRYKGFERDR